MNKINITNISKYLLLCLGVIFVFGFSSKNGTPDYLVIPHDDYHGQWVGKTIKGELFFATQPFVPAIGDNPGREFIAVYIFNENGSLKEARIDDLGTRANMDVKKAKALFKKRISELEKIEFTNIQVKPFKINKFNTEFGLIPAPPEEKGGEWQVILEPGNYMAFYPPWNGDYDT